MALAFALLAILTAAAGYLLGVRRGLRREEALKVSLEERAQQLSLVEDELLRHQAVDPATGLHTRQYFLDFLEREWRRAARDRKPVAVIMLELDHFRAFAERHGSRESQACLKEVAAALKPMLHRPGDAIAGYGGSGAFGVVLGNTDAKGALVIAERLRTAVEGLKARNPAAPTSFLTATLGVAAATPDRQTAWQDIDLIAAAERALSEAREAGRNTAVLDATATVRS